MRWLLITSEDMFDGMWSLIDGDWPQLIALDGSWPHLNEIGWLLTTVDRI